MVVVPVQTEEKQSAEDKLTITRIAILDQLGSGQTVESVLVKDENLFKGMEYILFSSPLILPDARLRQLFACPIERGIHVTGPHPVVLKLFD